MPNEFDWQGPEVRMQDCILMDFACRPELCPGTSPGQTTIEQIWADNPDMMPTVLPVGRMNDQAAWWVSMRQSGQGSALKAVATKYVFNFPKDSVPGRYAAVGFSQGCSGIRELLAGSVDAERLDFVYACDGMHGALGNDGAVTEASIEPWIQFAVQAASGQKMMVVTHSEVVPVNRSKGVAGTEETAKALIAFVQKRLGYKEIAPRMIPRGLIGQAGYAPVPASGTSWNMWSKLLNKNTSVAGWPVKYYKIIGNLIVVGFNAVSPEETAAGYTSANSAVAHVFQDRFVKDQVLREVLACRWAAKCSSDLLNPENLTTNRAISSSPLPTMMMSPRFPSVLYAEPKPNVVLSGTNGLGTVASGGACVLEGTFSSLLSPSEMNSARTVGALKTAAIGVGAAAAGWWVLRKLLDRRDS